ncbi:hypothetical protein Apmu_0061_17 [Acidiphilium multivorum AIU301]|nr:hypothetical protein Apmu_0061_17 [Acidiphilium multivorum AIU301]
MPFHRGMVPARLDWDADTGGVGGVVAARAGTAVATTATESSIADRIFMAFFLLPGAGKGARRDPTDIPRLPQRQNLARREAIYGSFVTEDCQREAKL